MLRLIVRGILPSMAAVAFGCTLLTSNLARGESAIATAQNQVDNGDQDAAISTLTNFLQASIANPDVQRARAALCRISLSYAMRLANRGQLARGVEILLSSAKALGPGLSYKKLRKRASGLIKNKYLKSIASRHFNEALTAARLWTKDFPDHGPLADSSTRLGLEMQALGAAINRISPGEAYVAYERLAKAGATEKKMRLEGVKPASIVERYTTSLNKRGWYRRAAAVASGYLAFSGPHGKATRELTATIRSSLHNYLRVCEAFHNVQMADEALRLCVNAAVFRKGSLSSAEAAVRRIGKAAKPELLAPAHFLQGNGTWSANRSGYAVKGIIQIGNDSHDHGGDWKSGSITVQNGVVMEGGTILVSAGSLTLLGSPTRPIILRHMNIECDYTGQVTARFVVFQDCRLSKTGAWLWNSGYSAKWALTSCLLDESSFAGLWDKAYGLQLNRCTFLRCVLPQRTISEPQPDYSSLFRNQWSQISNCDLYDCTIPVSVVWMMRGCNIIRPADIPPFPFHGRSAFPVQVGTSAGTGKQALLRQLERRTSYTDVGRVVYTVSSRFRRQPSPLWKFVPPK